MQTKVKEWNVMGTWQFGEAKTADGQHFSFGAPPDKVEKIKQTLALVRDLDSPTSCKVTTQHGAYGQCTRYDITQHEYAAGGHPGAGGYIEALEVHNPPDDRCRFIIHEHLSHHYSYNEWFSEWKTLEDCLKAFEKSWGSVRGARKTLPEQKGFIRMVDCGVLTPWYYAVGRQELIGDFAFPEGIQQDSVYKFGRKFLVFDREGTPSLKVCMGARHIQYKRDRSQFAYRDGEEKIVSYRVVYWSDGTSWDESSTVGVKVRPLRDDEAWVDEALEQFFNLLRGESTEFTVDFTDGNQFVGRLKKANKKAMTVEGEYFAKILFEDGETKKGTFPFKPTPDTPDALTCINQRLFNPQGRTIKRVEITRHETKSGGKKWSGAFFDR